MATLSARKVKPGLDGRLTLSEWLHNQLNSRDFTRCVKNLVMAGGVYEDGFSVSRHLSRSFVSSRAVKILLTHQILLHIVSAGKKKFLPTYFNSLQSVDPSFFLLKRGPWCFSPQPIMDKQDDHARHTRYHSRMLCPAGSYFFYCRCGGLAKEGALQFGISCFTCTARFIIGRIIGDDRHSDGRLSRSHP